jgi:hypothetical protein
MYVQHRKQGTKKCTGLLSQFLPSQILPYTFWSWGSYHFFYQKAMAFVSPLYRYFYNSTYITATSRKTERSKNSQVFVSTTCSTILTDPREDYPSFSFGSYSFRSICASASMMMRLHGR